MSPSPSLGFQLEQASAMVQHQQLEYVADLSKALALTASIGMALFYVAILYAPTLVLRLPPPASFKNFILRRFICASISSGLSLLASAFLLPMQRKGVPELLAVYGIRLDHLWQALLFPFLLTSLMYTGSICLRILLLLDSWRDHTIHGGSVSLDLLRNILQWFFHGASATASNVLAWRNYVVAPLTEEVVFRACMIPLLLCGGFKTFNIILLCPIIFSLAHLNHFVEIYFKQNFNLTKALTIIGFQLGYTVIFGSYASFLFIRTGNLTAPLVAHVYCNFMGLPVLFSRRSGIISLAFVLGLIGFLCLVYPITSPGLYNDSTNGCKCWHAYCSW